MRKKKRVDQSSQGEISWKRRLLCVFTSCDVSRSTKCAMRLMKTRVMNALTKLALERPAICCDCRGVADENGNCGKSDMQRRQTESMDCKYVKKIV